jgi:tRNA (guanosine-2'-O-)-methyltransferase
VVLKTPFDFQGLARLLKLSRRIASFFCALSTTMTEPHRDNRSPHRPPIEVGDLELEPAEIIELLDRFLTDPRRRKINEVLDERTYHIVSVLDGIYDRGNVSAVIRSAEALGYQSMHVIESQDHFKEANRVTQGTEKWLDIERYPTPEPCIEVLRERGYRIVATELEASKPIGEVSFEEPTALVFGNEKDGVSEQVRDVADEHIVLPMVGFAQSYNISVSAALAFQHVFTRRREVRGRQGDLTDREREILRALYTLRSVDKPERLMRGLQNRGVGESG